MGAGGAEDTETDKLNRTASTSSQNEKVKATYYATSIQLVNNYTEEELDAYFKNTSKANIVCLTRELIGQLRKFSALHETLVSLTTAVSTLVDGNQEIGPKITSLSEDVYELKTFKPSWADIVTSDHSTVLTREHVVSETESSVVKREIRISGLPEVHGSCAKQIENDAKYVQNVLEHVGEYCPSEIECVYRVGKQRNTENARSRNLIVQFHNEWSAQKCLSKGHKLKDYSISAFLSRSLTKTEQELENKVLSKRAELIRKGTSRDQLKVKNLKLYLSGEEVDLDN